MRHFGGGVKASAFWGAIQTDIFLLFFQRMHAKRTFAPYIGYEQFI
jgi:hypothetical protein